MSPQAHIALVQQAYAAFGAGDPPKLLGLLADDVAWDFPPSTVIPWAGRFDGPREVARFFAALGGASHAEAFEPQHYLAADDRVVVLGRERFRVPSTGKTWECEWAHVFRVRDGKIAAFREYTDTGAMEAALRKD